MAAGFKVQHAGTLRTITTAYVRQAGVNRRLKTAKVMDGGVLRTVGVFADPLAVTISPSAPTEVALSPPSPQSVSASATALPTGGISPYTYSWTHISGDSFTIGSPSSATTTFSKTLIAGNSESGVYRVTVTDSLGSTATADATVILQLN